MISDGCSVIEDKSQEVKPCILPFIYYGKTMRQCTPQEDPDNKPWCSTKVDAYGNHISDGGNWGHCGQDCFENQAPVLRAELPFGEGNVNFNKINKKICYE